MDLRKKLQNIEDKVDEINIETDVAPLNSVLNTDMNHPIGNKADDAIYDPSSTASLIAYMKGALNRLELIAKLQQPNVSFIKTFQEYADGAEVKTDDVVEVTAPAPNKWFFAADAIRVYAQIPAGGSGRIVTKQAWPTCTVQQSAIGQKISSIWKWKTSNTEFLIAPDLLDVNDFLAGNSFFGLTRLKTDTLSATNLIGIVPLTTGLRCVVKSSGNPDQTHDVALTKNGEPWKVRIECSYDDAATDKVRVRFWINEVMQFQTDQDIPDRTPYINLYAATGANGRQIDLYFPSHWMDGAIDDRYI